MTSKQIPSDSLRTSARWLCGALGIVAFSLAFVMSYSPPSRTTTERNAKSEVVKSTITSSDTTTPFTALIAGGLALLLYGLNGYKLVKFSAAGISGEAARAATSAEEYYGATSKDVEPLSIEKKEGEAPQPTQAPVATIRDAGEDIAVYELKDVPTFVVRDALTEWPVSEPSPDNLGDFEFASRKRGKGNHPWTLKFRGRRPIVVSYGGYAKAGPTVQSG